MKKYTDTSKDEPGKPSLPINIAMNRIVLEQVFKYVLEMVLTENRIGNEHITEINKMLVKRPIIYAGGRIDFGDESNRKIMKKLVTEVWDMSKKVLYREIASNDFHRAFSKK